MGEQVAAGYIWGCSSVGRAPALQAGGQEFESLHLHGKHEQCPDGLTNTSQACLNECLSDRLDSAKHVMK